MKYPLATITALYILGIILGEYLPAPLPWLFPAGFALLIGAVVITRARLSCLVGLVLLAGWTNQVIHTEIISPRDLRVLIGTEPTDTSLRGRVRSLDVRRYESDGKEKWRSFARVETQQILAQAGWQPAEGMVLVTTYESLQGSYFPGQEVEISGVLHQPALPIARGLFDYRLFLCRQGIHYQLDAYTSADWKPIGPVPRDPLKDKFLAWSKNTLFHGLLDEDQSLRLIWAMTLGWRSGIDEEVSEDLMRSGTMHIFAKMCY